MKFETKKHVTSVTTPGVTFTIRILGEPARAKVEVETAEARGKQRDLALESQEMDEEIAAIGVPPLNLAENSSDEDIAKAISDRDAALTKEQRNQFRRLTSKRTQVEALFLNLYTAQIAPAWLRAGFLSAEGLDGYPKKPTAEDIIEGPARALFNEITEAVFKEANLLPEAAKNSESLSSLAAVEDGATKTTTAPNASEKEPTN